MLLSPPWHSLRTTFAGIISLSRCMVFICFKRGLPWKRNASQLGPPLWGKHRNRLTKQENCRCHGGMLSSELPLSGSPRFVLSGSSYFARAIGAGRRLSDLVALVTSGWRCRSWLAMVAGILGLAVAASLRRKFEPQAQIRRKSLLYGIFYLCRLLHFLSGATAVVHPAICA